MPFPYTPMRKNEIQEFSFLLLLLSTNQKIGWPEICCLQRVTIIKVIVKSQSVLKGEKSAMTYVKVIESYFPCPNQHSYCSLNEYHETATLFSTPSFVTMIWSLPIFFCNTRKIFYFRKHVVNNKWMSHHPKYNLNSHLKSMLQAGRNCLGRLKQLEMTNQITWKKFLWFEIGDETFHWFYRMKNPVTTYVLLWIEQFFLPHW